MNTKLLIVDDDLANRELIFETLRTLNLDESDMFQADNGLEALDVALREKPAIIFLDIEMPIMSGIEVCQLIKCSPALADTTVVMVTCRDDSLDFRRAEKAGADAYLVKPFSLQALR